MHVLTTIGWSGMLKMLVIIYNLQVLTCERKHKFTLKSIVKQCGSVDRYSSWFVCKIWIGIATFIEVSYFTCFSFTPLYRSLYISYMIHWIPMSGYLRINLMYRWIVEAEASNKPEIPHYMKKVQVKRKKIWQRWDSNPRHICDWCLKPTP